MEQAAHTASKRCCLIFVQVMAYCFVKNKIKACAAVVKCNRREVQHKTALLSCWKCLSSYPTNEHSRSTQGNYISYLKNNYVKAGNVNVHITSFQTIFLATNPSVLPQSFFQKRINAHLHKLNMSGNSDMTLPTQHHLPCDAVAFTTLHSFFAPNSM